jgi:anti-sigma factor RsiW
MDCRTAERLISLQPDGQLTIEESAALAVHVAKCRACANEQQLQERLSRTLQEIGRFELEAPAELGSLVMNRLKAERRSPFKHIPATWRKAVAAAAALMLIAGSSAGVTGILKMAGGGKTLVLESTPPAVSVDVGSGQAASGEPAGSTGWDIGANSTGGAPGIGELPGGLPGDNSSPRNSQDEINDSEPMAATTSNTISNTR